MIMMTGNQFYVKMFLGEKVILLPPVNMALHSLCGPA